MVGSRPTQFRDENFLLGAQLFESKFVQFVDIRTIFVEDEKDFIKLISFRYFSTEDLFLIIDLIVRAINFLEK